MFISLMICVISIQASAQKVSGKSKAGIPLSIPTEVEKEKTQAPKLPEISIISPSINPFTSQTEKIQVISKIINVQNENEIQLKIGNEISTLLPKKEIIPEGLQLTWNINLTIGKNEIEIIAKNSNGTKNQKTTIEYKKPLEPPVITLINPQSNSSTSSNNTYQIVTQIKNIKNKDDIVLKLNKQVQSIIPKEISDKEGMKYSWIVRLSEGQNEFEIIAKNETKEETKKFSILYKKSVEPPQIALVSPQTNSSVSSSNTYEVIANIKNVRNKEDVQLKMNKQLQTMIPKEIPMQDGVKFTWNINLTDGQNEFEIRAKNETKEEFKNFTITYKKLVEPPLITRESPQTNSSVSSSSTYEVIANIKNVRNKDDVQLKMNKQIQTIVPKEIPLQDGVKLTWSINLFDGQNDFEIIAKNSDNPPISNNFSIEYKKPQPAPLITIIFPAENPYKTSSQKIRISAFIKYVINESDIILKRGEGEEFKIFKKEDIPDGLKLTYQVDLIEGQNDFEMIAKNPSATKTSKFMADYRKPLPPPEITLVNPSETPYSTTTSRIRIVANISNVKNEGDVILKRGSTEEFKITKNEPFLNGLKLTWQLDLTDGQNDFEIIAWDNSGKDYPKTFRIYYNSPTVTSMLTKIWAVIVGITKYDALQYNTLKYASSDAQYFYDWLKDTYGDKVTNENVRLLLNKEATRNNIVKELHDVLGMASSNDFVIVYFACHGETPTGKGVYFVCYDSDPSNIYATAISDAELINSLRDAQANKKLIIADACHAGAANSDWAIKRGISETNKLLLELASLRGFPFLLAAGSNQYSYEDVKWGNGHGVFTYYLVKGLRGEADIDANNYISVDEMFEYVKVNVRKDTGGKQVPTLKGGEFDPDFYISYKKNK
jgi:hypothetical protein